MPFLSENYWQYNFPPFFTIQPNLQTRQVQLEAWNELILNYCKEKSIYQLDINHCINQIPFSNPSLNRSLNTESILVVLDYMKTKGTIEWIDKNKSSFHIYWKKPEQWATIIYDWSRKNGITNTVCTLYELVFGDDTKDQPFHGMDIDLLKLSLKTLETEGKAALISHEGSEGVKFL